jgi:hypothetical protein
MKKRSLFSKLKNLKPTRRKIKFAGIKAAVIVIIFAAFTAYYYFTTPTSTIIVTTTDFPLGLSTSSGDFMTSAERTTAKTSLTDPCSSQNLS